MDDCCIKRTSMGGHYQRIGAIFSLTLDTYRYRSQPAVQDKACNITKTQCAGACAVCTA